MRASALPLLVYGLLFPLGLAAQSQEEWLTQLEGQDPEARRRAIKHFAEDTEAPPEALRPRLESALFAALHVAAGEPLQEAAQALERLASPHATPSFVAGLEGALTHADKGARVSLALTLAACGPSAAAARPGLRRLCSDPDASVRFAAERALGKIIRGQVSTVARISFIAMAISGILGAILVQLISDKRRPLLHSLAALSLLGICVKAISTVLPNMVFWLDGVPNSLYFERDIAFPFALIFFSLAARLLDEERKRRAIVLLLAFLAVVYVSQNAWLVRTPPCYERSDGFWRDDVCIQSTSYTCGAASIATLLRARGVVDATEHESAALSHTIPERGVTDLGAATALRAFLPTATIRLRPATIDQLAQIATPCLLPLRFSFWFDHMTVLLKVEGDTYVIGDPLQGQVRMPRTELEKRWLGRVITVE